MPTYEYTCKTCHQNIEVFQPFSAKALKKHADCGGDLQKVFHARGVLFKGSGFYANDSRPAEKSSSSEPAATSNGAKDGAKEGAKDGAKGSKDKAAVKKPEPAKPQAD